VETAVGATAGVGVVQPTATKPASISSAPVTIVPVVKRFFMGLLLAVREDGDSRSKHV
jgi:hypothetical protein